VSRIREVLRAAIADTNERTPHRAALQRSSVRLAVGVALLGLGLGGCATHVVPIPSAITLESALVSVGQGLVAMKQAQLQQNQGKEFSTGLLASEAEVTFNVIGSGQQGGTLFVEMSPVPTAPAAGKAGGELSTSYTASRGNQITIKFRSVAFSKKTTKDDVVILEGPTDPKLLKEIIEALKDSGITPYVVKPDALK
jgi:hypothetical protein